MVSPGTTSGVGLSKSMLRWVAVGLVLSSAVVAIITVSSGVTLSDVARLGYLSFALAAAASLGRLLVQDVRFRLIAEGLAGSDPKPDLRGWGMARTASEFVALSTPAMIGGEFLRAAWLSSKGVDGGKALWIGYFEVIIDVYVDSALALVSAWFAFTRGATAIGLTIVVVVPLLVIGYSVFFVIPALRGIPKIPHRLFAFVAIFIGGERARRLEASVQRGTVAFSLAAGGTLRRDLLPLVLKAVGLTVILVLLSGVALWSILTAAGLNIDLLSSTLIAGGVAAIATIPITIGGSGLTELTMASYLSSVYGFSSWTAVVIWRIASYQVVLAVAGVAFLLLVHGHTKDAGPEKRLADPDQPLES
jgi:glycosyltransferase 2 family protein